MSEDITIMTNEGLVLIDTGYYMFHRYFASLIWFRIVKKDETVDVSELHNNSEFIDAFKGHIKADVLKFAMYPYFEKRFGPRLPLKNKRVRNRIMFCLDCKRSDIWRTKIYPQYKASRKHATDMNMNIVGVFYDYLEELMKELQETVSISKLSLDGLEADDVVYFTIKSLRPKYEQPILVITNDNDFVQMVNLNVAVVNMKGVYLLERAIDQDPKINRIVKILMGDISDNIKAVPCIKSNRQVALSVAHMTEKDRHIWMKGHGTECLRAYKLNKKLISLSLIPKNLAQTFAKKYKFTVVKAI